MSDPSRSFRLSAATATHRGDRQYQQDRVEVIAHPKVAGCLLMVVADGMGGKSGGRKASDQVLLVARQLFERFAPSRDNPGELLRKVVQESHVMIRLTAITSEQEPHSTVAAALVLPDRQCHIAHAGDSRVYVFRGSNMLMRTFDHSLVQRMIEQGTITEAEALTHPQGNLLIGCLGGKEDPPITQARMERLNVGDSLLLCSDGLWHYFTSQELGTVVHALKPGDATKMLLQKARQRAQGSGDNLSMAVVKVEVLVAEAPAPTPPAAATLPYAR